MNDKEFGTRLKPWLDRSAAAVGEMQATRLKAARRRALDRVREPVRLLGLVTVGAGTAETIRYSVVQRALLWLPVLALLTVLAVQSVNETDVGEIDAQLLTGELPPQAFLDQDFRSWLGKSRN
jgi:hypothetical protein